MPNTNCENSSAIFDVEIKVDAAVSTIKTTGSDKRISIPSANLRGLCFNWKQFDIYLVQDCEGFSCCFIAELILWSLTLIAHIFIYPKIESTFGKVILHIIGFILPLFASTAHLKTAFNNPGTIGLNSLSDYQWEQIKIKQPSYKRCHSCNCIKKPSTHHCRQCKRCVKHMDHHCPWVNNCVGQDNMKHFLVYNFYVANYSVYNIIVLTYTILRGRHDIEKNPLSCIILFVFLIFAVLFCLFTCTMLCATAGEIYNDDSRIKRYKRKMNKEKKDGKTDRDVPKKGFYNLKKVFGHSLKPFLPFSPRYVVTFFTGFVELK